MRSRFHLTLAVRRMLSGFVEARRQSNTTARRPMLERRLVTWEARRKMWREVAERVKQEHS